VWSEPINSKQLRTVARQAIARQSAERGRPHIQHRAKSLAAGFRCEPAQPEPKVRAAKWAGDITYVWTREGWVYLAVILDLHSRRVIGWAISNRMKKDLAIRALNMAIALRRPPRGCIHHTDRGSQYCLHDYQKVLRKHGLTASMSGKGNCYDNAAVESFFKSLKAEMTWRRNWQTRREVEVAILEY
jgi:transposase InsO family protein